MRPGVVVTGASGLLGSLLVARWAGRYRLTAVSHRQRVRHPGVESVQADLAAPEVVSEAIRRARPALVVHAAAWTDVDGCEADPALAEAINARGTRWVARAAASAGAALAYISTDSVFDGARGGYAEGDTPAPVNSYARSKLAGEHAALEEHPQALIVRVPLEGWRPTGRPGFVQWVVQRLRRGEPTPVCTDWIRNPVTAGNLALILEAAYDKRLSGFYHAGAPQPVSNAELARLVADIFGLDGTLLRPILGADLRLKAARPRNTTLEAGKLAAAIGSPCWSVRDGVAAMRDELDRGRVEHSRAMVRQERTLERDVLPAPRLRPAGAPVGADVRVPGALRAGLQGQPVIFRCDGSLDIGLGHIVRCLTLAEAFHEAGFGPIRFVTRAHSTLVTEKIARAGFAVDALPATAGVLQDLQQTLEAAETAGRSSGVPALVMTDCHELPAEHYTGLKDAGLAVFSIDDYAGTAYASDVVLNHHITAETYRFEVRPWTRLLLGPAYVPLRREFREPVEARGGSGGARFKHVVVCLGGMPALADYRAVLEGARRFAATKPLHVTLVLGLQTAVPSDLIEQLAGCSPGSRVVLDGEPLGPCFQDADAALVSGGLVAYEAAALGLPMLITSLGSNQDDAVAGFHARGAALSLGPIRALTPERVTGALSDFAAHPALRAGLSARARAVVDGRGVQRIVEEARRLCAARGQEVSAR